SKRARPPPPELAGVSRVRAAPTDRAALSEMLTSPGRPEVVSGHGDDQKDGPPPARGGPRTQRPPAYGSHRNGSPQADTAREQKKDPIRSASREGVRGGCSGAWQL